MNAQKVRQKIALYQTIAEVIHQQEFKVELADRAVALCEAVKDEVAITNVTTNLLRELHEANHSDKGDFDSLLWLVGVAFSDLAKHLRWPVARRTFESLRRLVDSDGRDLFLRITNVRPLADDPDGCAVVTMVVDNHRKFQEFLQNKNAVENVRFSDDETIAI